MLVMKFVRFLGFGGTT